MLCRSPATHPSATVEEARAWYYSDAYQSAARHRHAGATYRGFVVEGVT
ncbi:DUF1330 domain-containing protein [Dickeya dianthicola]|uniref:DUF1330 domain-containing protein n=1 Tax=Dickeya dianthicola TaxID=204039 RepID=A0AAP6VI45_9GAMM|nr:DUF1330 domain-containing protein [Dickeya dianthicola]MBI0451146.1 DUF1330 domain-containing protein [Dickeya dianthicola]MBI0455574.1 DUF1330 domain-containing protein [Dickeya dianthicola]MBI0459902.1 DUF1330 domain-containing protein [Dickeya dianthicola]MBI0464332.1 DUF1330 domain-containing protein [Dickeya dianthicola]